MKTMRKMSTLSALLRIAVLLTVNVSYIISLLDNYYDNRIIVHKDEASSLFLIASQSKDEASKLFQSYFPVCSDFSNKKEKRLIEDYCSSSFDTICNKIEKYSKNNSSSRLFSYKTDVCNCYVKKNCDNSSDDERQMILYPGCSCSNSTFCRFGSNCDHWKRISNHSRMTFEIYNLKKNSQIRSYIQTGSRDEIFNNSMASVLSDLFRQSGLNCTLRFSFHFSPQGNRQDVPSRLVVRAHVEGGESMELWEYPNYQQLHRSTEKIKIAWMNANIKIGSFSSPFRLSIDCESGSPPKSSRQRTGGKNDVFACGIANIDFAYCQDVGDPASTCFNSEMAICNVNSNVKCIPDAKCDFKKDCSDGSDEAGCESMPTGSRCDFNDITKFCDGWYQITRIADITKNEDDSKTITSLNNPSVPVYLFRIRQPGSKYNVIYEARKGSRSVLSYEAKEAFNLRLTMRTSALVSPEFPPTNPNAYDAKSSLFQTCKLRFYICARIDFTKWQIAIISKMNSTFDSGRRILYDSKMFDSTSHLSLTCDWQWKSVPIPRQNSAYRLAIFVDHGTDMDAFLAIDDLSFSPSCFDKNYSPSTWIIPDVLISPCGHSGSEAPIAASCEKFRNNDGQSDHFLNEDGTQVWTVPSTGFYRIEACGGGGGSSNFEVGRPGNCAVMQVHFMENQDVRLLIGQLGEHSCYKFNEHDEKEVMSCIENSQNERGLGGGGGGGATLISVTHDINKWNVVAGGGGGGSTNQANNSSAILSAGYGASAVRVEPVKECGTVCKSLSRSGFLTEKHKHICPGDVYTVFGGFGGGGNSCGPNGGSGAGHWAGNPLEKGDEKSGSSFVDSTFARDITYFPAKIVTEGHVKIGFCRKKCRPPTVCRFRGELLSEEYCGCPDGSEYSNSTESCLCQASCPNSSKCLFRNLTYEPYCKCNDGRILDYVNVHRCEDFSPSWIFLFILLLMVFITAIVAFLFVRHYKVRNDKMEKELIEFNMLKTNDYLYDDIYFGKQTRKSAIEKLPKVNRESLKLGRVLGKGNFGEVLYGEFYSENVRFEAAVKTISKPFGASISAQSDFCNEALCMGTFVHENIVRLIGVDLEVQPYLIAIEFMEGGDLLSFVKEARPNVSSLNPFSITMQELVTIACDVAAGCACLEEFGYVHRDIAARNILLTRKSSGRIAKIADFGMAKEMIYGSDYYRVHGRAMLPIKWTPPEAFIDGVFTTKSDVWSFGILCWEVFSLGVVPYPNRRNEEVMLLLTEGARLEYPYGIPTRIYQLMRECWKTSAADRPRFDQIHETLIDIRDDPLVISMPFPIHPAVMASFAHIQSTPQSCETPQTAITEISLLSAFTEASTVKAGNGSAQQDLNDRMKLHELMLVREVPYVSEMAEIVVDNLRKDLSRAHAQNGMMLLPQPHVVSPDNLFDENNHLIDNENTVTDQTPPSSLVDLKKLAVQDTGPALHRPTSLNFQENYSTPLLANSDSYS